MVVGIAHSLSDFHWHCWSECSSFEFIQGEETNQGNQVRKSEPTKMINSIFLLDAVRFNFQVGSK